ncbi:PAS domain-containing protein [Halobacillus shinanisalinarum]|uniref:PAS domain-containing protein n=1 Tax=Halobacillus shinanisalinarum TaxID=2932258 RepID=A0ABY4GUX3_9BACI|nr:PAS domain-containing protein [Halobacillus shinanisalinarum]UOQ91698.1 PAS domain-containing protein [Halobacillus shinanisalinarum]
MVQKVGHPWDILRQLSIPVWFFNSSECSIYINAPLMQRILAERSSYSLADLGRVIHPNDIEHVRELLQRPGGDAVHLNYRLKMNGEYKWIEDMIAPLYAENGGFIGYTGQSLSLLSYKEELEDLKKSVIEIGESFAANAGQSFFDFLVKCLAKVLQVDTVIIGELTGGDRDQITAVSMFHKGEISKRMTYQLEGTPCEEVIIKCKECYIPRGLMNFIPMTTC